MMNCELRQLNTFIKSCSTSNAAIKNTASPIPKEGWYPAYSASGQDVWLPEYRYSGKGIVVSAVGARCGKCFQADGKWNVTANTHVLLVDESIADYKYCWYLLNNENWWIKSGSGQPFVKVKDSLNRSILLPDLSTQQNIATILDKISEGIALCRKMMDELDLMVKAKFGEMFGDLSSPECQWEKCHLIEVCANKDDIKCGPFGTQLSKEEYLSEGVAVWEIPQINSQFAKKPTHFLTRQKAEQLSAYSLLPGDIAMSRKGNVGKCAIFPSCFAPGIIHSDVLRIRVDSAKVNPIFMMSQLHYSGAVTRQIEIVSLGAIMAGINVTKLKQIIVHVPPYAIQNRFAAFVAEIDKSKLTIQKILDKMETEKLALMQEYFG